MPDSPGRSRPNFVTADANGHVFKSWPQLAEEIAHAVRSMSVVLDGEICCLDADGRSNFRRLMFRRDWPFFYAFDVRAAVLAEALWRRFGPPDPTP